MEPNDASRLNIRQNYRNYFLAKGFTVLLTSILLCNFYFPTVNYYKVLGLYNQRSAALPWADVAE